MSHFSGFVSDWHRRVFGVGAGILLCTSGLAAQKAETGAVAAPRVEPIVSMRTGASGPISPVHNKSYEFTLKDGAWLDTGVDLAVGETVSFAAKGEFTLGDERVSGPDGLARGYKDLLRAFPLNSAKTGELIGRVSDVGASVPFAIGAQSDVTMPTSGRLFLRVNASDDLAGTGEFKVKVKFAAGSGTASGSGTGSGSGSGADSGSGSEAHRPAAVAAGDVSALVSPETFADIPRRVSDQAGNDGDMVNYALLGTEAQVTAAFKAAGWVQVDKTVEGAVLHGLLATLSHEAYTEMPMSTLYLFGRAQDLSFARGDPLKVAAERHHLRVWKTDRTLGGTPLWVGSATHDVGFEKDQRNGNLTHKIDPKVDGEREFLLQSFDAAGVFSSAAYVTPAGALREARTATGGSFYSDGRILVMGLK